LSKFVKIIAIINKCNSNYKFLRFISPLYIRFKLYQKCIYKSFSFKNLSHFFLCWHIFKYIKTHTPFGSVYCRPFIVINLFKHFGTNWNKTHLPTKLPLGCRIASSTKYPSKNAPSNYCGISQSPSRTNIYKNGSITELSGAIASLKSQKLSSFFVCFFLILTSFYILISGVEGQCCLWSISRTQNL
jgi:hypothetical protein